MNTRIEINLDHLTQEIGIDKDSLSELLNIYCGEISEEMLLVRKLWTDHDYKALQRTIHNIKGVSANLFLLDMFKITEQADKLLKENQYNSLEPVIERLEEVFAATVSGIQEAIKRFRDNFIG